jgi:hypothetical protein
MIYRSILVSLFALGAGISLRHRVNALRIYARLATTQQGGSFAATIATGSGVFGDHYFYHFVALHRLVVGTGRAAIAQYADHGRASATYSAWHVNQCTSRWLGVS